MTLDIEKCPLKGWNGPQSITTELHNPPISEFLVGDIQVMNLRQMIRRVWNSGEMSLDEGTYLTVYQHVVGVEAMSMDEITQGQGIASEENKTQHRVLESTDI